MNVFRTTGLLLLATSLAACTTSNDRATVGDVLAIEAFAPSVPPAQTLGDPSPSLSGLSRANWGRQAFLVPVDGTAGNTTYTTSALRVNDTARQRGQFPTSVSALDTADEFSSDSWIEAGLSGPLALWEVLLMGPRTYASPPWDEVRGSRSAYWRGTPTTLRSPLQRDNAAGAP